MIPGNTNQDRLALAGTIIREEGYELLGELKNDRYVNGVIRQAGERFFIKIADAPENRLKLENEKMFYEKYQAFASASQSFLVPKVKASGARGNQFWLIRPYLEQSAMLGEKNLPLLPAVADWLPKVVSGILHLQQANFSLPLDAVKQKETKDSESVREQMQKLAAKYAKDVRDPDPEPLLALITRTNFLEKRALATSDVVPWHLFSSDERLILIDTEAASNEYPIHYDAAVSFCRMFVSLPGSQMVAQKFLQFYSEQASLDEPARTHLRGLLAIRTLGQLRDASLGTGPNALHKELYEIVLGGNIL